MAPLVCSMTVSADGFVNDRHGGIDWSAPSDELFAFHLERTAELGAHLLGRRLFETMHVWETDTSLRSDPLRSRFADVWAALPKVVFSHSSAPAGGNARLATGPLADEVAALRRSTDRPIGIGGPTLTAAAMALGLVDEIRMFRAPVILGGGTPMLPPVADQVPLVLLETRIFDGRIVYERYRVDRS